MTRAEGQRPSATVKEILLSNPDGMGEVIRAVMQEVLDAEMERSELEGRAHAGARLGYRSGWRSRPGGSRRSTSAWESA